MLPHRARSTRPLLWVVALLAALAWPRLAQADQVDTMVSQLSSSSYKVRLSASLNLGKLRDRRAILPFIKALKDQDKTIRGVAAAGLGKIVSRSTSSDLRGKALAALKYAAAKDSNAFVRNQAQKAYTTITTASTSAGGGSVATGAIYVNIGGMSASTANSGTIKSLMRAAAQKTFRSKASKMVIDWPGTATPSASALSAKKAKGFYVDGTVVSLKVGGGAVQCEVSMLLATYPEKSMFGFLKGKAGVDGDDESASSDCVTAVIESLIASKIIPTIQARAGN